MEAVCEVLLRRSFAEAGGGIRLQNPAAGPAGGDCPAYSPSGQPSPSPSLGPSSGSWS